MDVRGFRGRRPAQISAENIQRGENLPESPDEKRIHGDFSRAPKYPLKISGARSTRPTNKVIRQDELYARRFSKLRMQILTESNLSYGDL